MNTNLKTLSNTSAGGMCSCDEIWWDYIKELAVELRKKRDKEQALLKKGHLSTTSQEVARVLILRYNEILGEEDEI
jgi:hypothetical protein